MNHAQCKISIKMTKFLYSHVTFLYPIDKLQSIKISRKQTGKNLVQCLSNRCIRLFCFM